MFCKKTDCFSGHGLRCQRAIKAVCELVGLRDLRAKIIGRSNPQNIMIATFKGLTAQVHYYIYMYGSNLSVEMGLIKNISRIPYLYMI